MSNAADRTAAVEALAAALDGRTIARLVEAAELHADALDRLDARAGDGELGDDAVRLRAAVRLLRDTNAVRPLLRR